ncbi:MAG TPA: Spy/CpxP family protein refolding chaperone [Tepidisphaeraceae bacterium]|jgi:Spy/CpxP family protein refolding chaperone|nr:Spy/CpxP family protein refolding chaperone [Tepidisphaeraceae bacterium]
MSKTRTILALAFVLVFAAGAVVGMVRQRVGFGPHGPEPRGSFLTKELNLTPAQQEQMRKIWAEQGPTSGRDREHWDRRREFQKQRDEAIKALLNDDQKAKYDSIQKDYTDHIADLQKERQVAFQQAVEKTKKILTPEQSAKYDEFLKRRSEGGGPGNGGPGGPGGGPPSWHDHHDPSTRHAV